MRTLRIDKYIITTPIINILYDLQRILTNGKLKDIKDRTDDIVVTCPVHNNGKEENPDCNIYVGEDLAIPYGFSRCFACDFKGTFDKFVAECFNSSLDYAKSWLIKNYGELAEEVVEIDDPIVIGKVKKTNYLDESILETYQHWTPYLAKRHLDPNICEKLKVRYDPKYRQVVFPVYDIKGHLKMLAKRSIDTKSFYLDKNQEKEVYCLNIIQKNNINAAIITEGPFDAISGWCFGMPTIATLGTISDYQIEQINKSCLNIIYAMFDSDEAGKRFNSILKAKLNKRIMVIDVPIPKPYKDLNDLDYETFKNIFENR